MNELFCELTLSPVGCVSALELARVLFSALLGVLFVQSGVDKIVDRAGNIGWLTGHFAKTPFAGQVPLLLSGITALELAAGGASGVGAVAILIGAGRGFAVLGALLSLVTLLCLFVGQRLAKDYPGSAVLANFFLLVLAGLFLLVR